MAPLWIAALLSYGIFAASSEFLSLIPGKLGIFVRRSFYRMTLDACGTDCHFGFGTTLARRQIWIGRGVYIGNRCTIGRVVIEDDVTIGSNADLLGGRRQHHFDRLDRPIQDQGGTFREIRIGRNSWIGNSAVVMADIGEDCVIGAGAVLVHDIPARTVAVGNPAVVKKVRPGIEAAA